MAYKPHAKTEDEPTTAQKQAKAATTGSDKGTDPNQHPLGSMTIKGEGTANAVGLFQTAPDVKEYLTADEARSRGFYVAPTDEEKAAKAKKR